MLHLHSARVSHFPLRAPAPSSRYIWYYHPAGKMLLTYLIPVLQLAFSELQVFFLFNPRGGRTTYCWLRRNSSVYSWFDGYMVQVNIVFMILVSLFSLLPLQGSIFTSSPPSFPHDHHHVWCHLHICLYYQRPSREPWGIPLLVRNFRILIVVVKSNVQV